MSFAKQVHAKRDTCCSSTPHRRKRLDFMTCNLFTELGRIVRMQQNTVLWAEAKKKDGCATTLTILTDIHCGDIKL